MVVAVLSFPSGGYRSIEGVFQYSAGVAADPGHEIVRIQFRKAVPLSDGLQRAQEYIRSAGRPLTAFCACELRSPQQFDESDFESFNRNYVQALMHWGLMVGTFNPVARSNVCPAINSPATILLHAFSFTRVVTNTDPTFVISGGAEAPEGRGNYRDHIVCLGDTSADGLGAKARYVLAEMERRLAALGFTWRHTTATQLYTTHNIYPLLPTEIVGRGAAQSGVTWHFCKPPVIDLEFEMDCRSVANEMVV